ncbi:MAG TPA: hypothetical protein VFE58_11615 [Tepidisphaeraceae bacterium]|jgi:L-fucose isomerase-like protein|nr:hypothetical protein [Tepidisphaeraceae bacterium]
MQSNNHPVGLLIIGRKRPGFDQDWNAIMRQKTAEAFATMKMPLFTPTVAVVDDESILAALAQIRAAGCDALVVLQPSLGNGQLSMTVAQHWPDPIILYATPERQTGEKVSSCSLVATHLWASVMRQAKHPFELVYGHPDAPETHTQLSNALAIARTVRKLRSAKIGLVGANAPGFIDMASDPFVLSHRLGSQLHPLSLTQFIDRVKSIPDADVNQDMEKVHAMKLPLVNLKADDLPTNSRYYLAIRQLMAEESLDAISIQCWPELSNLVGHWPYLAFTRLTCEGVPLSMEGDTDGAILALLANHLNLGVGFLTDWLEHSADTITFWHAGVAPLPLCYPVGSPNGPHITHHFNIQKPAVVDGPLRTDLPVTISRLWRCDGQYHLTAFPGTTIPPKRQLTGNTAWVHTPGHHIPTLFDTLCHAGMPHHVTLFQGHHGVELFKRTARALQLPWIG